jgi:hypothetical protein
MFTIIIGAVFAVECQDRNWMPRPDLFFLSWGFGFYIISGIMSLFSGICFFYEAWKVYKELLNREMEFTNAALQMSGYPMSQTQAYSYGQPSYGQPSYAPSYGRQSIGDQESYGGQSYEQKSYATQPSFDGKQSFGTQPSYSDKDYYDQGGYDPYPVKS